MMDRALVFPDDPSRAIIRSAPAPGLRINDRDALPSVYFGIRIDAAVNLLEAREYEALDRTERLRKALDEQRTFVNAVLDPSLGLALDLRTRVRPRERPPIQVALLGRVWGGEDRVALTARAETLQRQLLVTLPRHLTGSLIDDGDELLGWLSPFTPTTRVDAVMVTRREVTAIPSRPDTKVAYYFSVVPFGWSETDWTSVYAALSASRVAVVLSVALLPVDLPASFTSRLERVATHYGRLAKEDRLQGGLYHGERLIPPDAFAVDAERAWRDYARRYSDRAFVMRIQIAAEGALPAGVVEAVAGAIAAGDREQPSHLEGDRSAAAYEIRRAGSEFEQRLARWNLDALDVALLDGRPGIWRRADPPSADLAALCVIADARDAASAFRMPIAIDGTVPGFKVRRGHFGHAESSVPSGPAIRVGYIPGTEDAIAMPLDDLTKHALVAGSTGSGKTTTVLELLRQLWLDHGIPFLVIEPVNSDANDYRRLLSEPGFETLELYTVGDEGVRPLRFNPFEVPAGVLVGEHIANLLACFKAAYGLWEPLPSIYQDALNHTYLRAGVLSSERATGEARAWPTAVEFMHAMRNVTANLGYSGEVKDNIEAASIRRAEQLAAGVSASAFLTSQPNDIGRLLDRPVILELKSLGSGDEQSAMMALLLNALTEHYQVVRGASPRLVHVTVIEEAHRLLTRPAGGRAQEEGQAKEKAAEAFANTLAENRKYGEGMIIAEQIPTKLVVDALKNTNLKVMHRLTAEDDRNELGETMGFDEAQKRFATRLRTGEALIYNDELAEATLVEVRRSHGAGELRPPMAASAPPFAACSICRAQCEYRGAALAIVRDSVIVDDVWSAVGVLESRDSSYEDSEAEWRRLTDLLRSRVRAFSALPVADPGVTDAAYCLFVHAMAIRRTQFAPTWPTAVADRLGITTAVAEGEAD